MTIAKFPRRKFLHLAAGAAALPAISRIAWAQAYPTRPITMVVPFAAGGSGDVVGRLLIERMRASLGQPITIENVAGAGGNIGVGRVARAAPDGYTLSLGQTGTHVVNGATYTLQHDLLNDFEPISQLAESSLLICARKTLAPTTLSEFINWLKANPDKASQGHAGTGSLGHVTGILFQKETGTRFGFVPYRGGAPAVQDLVAGHTDLTMGAVADALPHVRSGAIKAYAVTSKTRIASAPQIPTVDEAGLPRFYVSFWHGLWAPRGTPKPIIVALNSAVGNALADPAVQSGLANVGVEIPSRERMTPEGFGAFHKAEIEKWWPIIKAANIKGE